MEYFIITIIPKEKQKRNGQKQKYMDKSHLKNNEIYKFNLQKFHIRLSQKGIKIYQQKILPILRFTCPINRAPKSNWDRGVCLSWYKWRILRNGQCLTAIYERKYDKFNVETLLDIHRTILGQIYELAGEYRTIMMTKRFPLSSAEYQVRKVPLGRSVVFLRIATRPIFTL